MKISFFASKSQQIQEKYVNNLDVFLESLGGEKILNTGCGYGNDCRYVFEKSFEFVGMGLSEKMINISKENLHEHLQS